MLVFLKLAWIPPMVTVARATAVDHQSGVHHQRSTRPVVGEAGWSPTGPEEERPWL